MSSPSNAHRRLMHVAIAVVLLSSRPLSAAELDFPLSPSPVGSGARAAGMADAFVAIADDATAASWNPAGLVQLERPEISLVGSFNAISEEFMANYHPEFDSIHSDENLDLNFLSVAYPLPFLILGRNAVVSLNYQRKYDFSRNFKIDYNTFTPLSRSILSQFQTMTFEQEGGLSTITPAFAIELTHRLSVGVSLNLWRSSFLAQNDWEQRTTYELGAIIGASPWPLKQFTREQYSDFKGENLTLGILWNVRPKWSLGVRYDTAFTGEAGYRKTTTRLSYPFSPSFSLQYMAASSREKREIRFPDTLVLGVSYRANDRLTLALDLSRTDWNDFYVKNKAGRKLSLIDGKDLGDRTTRTHLDPTYTVRLGAEYVFIPKQPSEDLNRLWTLRGGLFYDEEPATGRSTRNPRSRGNGKPDRFYGLAGGVGLLAFQRVSIDMAYQLRYGPGVNSDYIRGIGGFEEDVFQHRVLLSTVVYF